MAEGNGNGHAKPKELIIRVHPAAPFKSVLDLLATNAHGVRKILTPTGGQPYGAVVIAFNCEVEGHRHEARLGFEPPSPAMPQGAVALIFEPVEKALVDDDDPESGMIAGVLGGSHEDS